MTYDAKAEAQADIVEVANDLIHFTCEHRLESQCLECAVEKIREVYEAGKAAGVREGMERAKKLVESVAESFGRGADREDGRIGNVLASVANDIETEIADAVERTKRHA